MGNYNQNESVFNKRKKMERIAFPVDPYLFVLSFSGHFVPLFYIQLWYVSCHQ